MSVGYPVTSAELADYIGTADDEALASDLAVAIQLVDAALATAPRHTVPWEVVDRLHLEVGQAVYDRRKASSSQAGQFAQMNNGVPVRAPRDPLATVWPIIRRYVRPF